MTRHKLALLAASLAGGAVLIWAVVETLREPVEPRSTEEALADSPIARLVARMGPPDPSSGAAAWATADGTWGWEGWRRAAAELRAGGDMTGNSDGELGFLRGRSFWDGDPDLDGARGRRAGRMRGIAAAREGTPGERTLRGHPYRLPRPGKPTILTSGRRLGRPDMRLPHAAAVSLGLDDHQRIPVRVEVCVDRRGRPQEVEVVEGTGVEAVDNYVAREMLAGRYRPLRQDGRRVAFCERTTVILGS
ncbi:MAG TPA: hypothetical protein VFU21_23675 [Kofleriaceae bacterium]|nr:hypothetical protein [Kofleriaceae bacterium]